MNKLALSLSLSLSLSLPLAACSGSGSGSDGSDSSSSASTGTFGGNSLSTGGGTGSGNTTVGSTTGNASSGNATTTASTNGNADSSGSSSTNGNTTSTNSSNGNTTSTNSGNGSTSTSAGNGSTSTSAGNGSTSTSAGNGSTTSTSGGAGAGTFADPGFSDMRLAPDPDGSMHLAFEDGVAQYVNYGHCTSNCSDPNNWNAVRLLDLSQLNATAIWPGGLGRDGTGTLHMLVGGVPYLGSSGGVRVMYGACSGGCTTPSNWNAVDLTGLFPNDYVTTDGEAFAVEPSGRVSFLSGGGYYQPYYATCSSNCLQAGSWQAGPVFDSATAIKALRVDAQGVNHALLSIDTGVTGERVLAYARCQSGCTQASNWVKSAQGFLQSTSGISSYSTAFAVTASGRLWMFFQPGGLAPAGQSDHVLQGWTCAGASCTDLSNWTGVSFAVADEGDEGIGAATFGESVVLTSTGHYDLHLFACDGSCENPSNWNGPQSIDSPDAISAALAPDNNSNCPGSATFAAWYPKGPVVGISSAGAVVLHDPYTLYTCPGDSSPSTAPTIGRVISSF